MKTMGNVVVVAGIMLVVMGGCGSSGNNNTTSCVQTQYCPPGTHCHAESGICVEDEPCDLCNPSTQVCYNDTCVTRCVTSQDCGPNTFCDTSVHGCIPITSDGDQTDQEAQEEEEAYEGPCVAPCPDDEVCFQAPGQSAHACYQKCNPYAPVCTGDFLCHLPSDTAVLPLEQGLCVPPLLSGGTAGVPCDGDSPCQVNLKCFGDYCRSICNPWDANTCGDDAKCKLAAAWSTGVCVPEGSCHPVDNPCPNGFVCLNDQCVPGQACASDAECLGTMVCQWGLCVENCVYTSCPSHMPACNVYTGHCSRETLTCSGGCPSGYFCESGRCRPDCDPACEGREFCTFSDNHSYCTVPRDCRQEGNTCMYATQECDQRIGFCVTRCPVTCAVGTCCDHTTDYACGACLGDVCSEVNPTGPCPLFDQVCVNGQCHTDTNICVPAGMPCSAGSKCCTGTTDIFIDCCVDPTNSALTGVCCGDGQTCLFIMSLCL